MSQPEPPGRDQLTPALQALVDGDAAVALELLDAELVDRPDDPTLLCNYGAALLSVGRCVEAAQRYRRAEALGAGPAALLAYNIGLALATAGDSAGAELEYRRAIELDDTMAQAHGNLGVLLCGCRDFLGAEQALRRAIELAPQDLGLRSNLGAVYCAAGDHQDAAVAYRAALALVPTDTAAVCGLATALILSGKGQDAVAVLEQWDGERGGLVLRQLALAQSRSGNVEAAETMYRELRELYPQDAWIANGLGAVLEMRGKRSDAQESFKRAIELRPEWADAHYNLGVSLEHEQALEQAATAYERAVALDGAHLSSLKNLASVLRMLGRHQDAAATYRRALALAPGDDTARHMLAALEGAHPAVAPAAYVRELFDAYAERYDAHMRTGLSYRAPEDLLRCILREAAHEHFDRALDLGCGTGLMGRVLRPHAGHLLGVDLSPKMLETCARAGYDQLVLGDIVDQCHALAASSMNLCTASDVLNYLGDLAPVFAGVEHVLAPGGIWAFSAEAGQDSDTDGALGYALASTGRYLHRQSYIEACGSSAGLRVLSVERVPIRFERGEEVGGLVVVVVRA